MLGSFLAATSTKIGNLNIKIIKLQWMAFLSFLMFNSTSFASTPAVSAYEQDNAEGYYSAAYVCGQTVGKACILATAPMTHGLDTYQTGWRKLITGEHHATVGAQGLMGLGLSETNAELLYGAMALSSEVLAARALLRATSKPVVAGRGGSVDDVALATNRGVSVKDIPGIGPTPGKGGFAQWFDNLNAGDFAAYWANPATKAKIQRMLREPGGFHEWAMVSRADKFHNWGFSARDIWSFRTGTKNLTWTNPITGLLGKHGGHCSGAFHHELGQLIDNSSNLGELQSGLISLGSSKSTRTY